MNEEKQAHNDTQPEWRPEEAIMDSGRWYREQNRKLMGAILAMSVAMSFFVVSDLLWDVFVKPKPEYFGITPALRVIPLTPMDHPVSVSMGIENWAADTVTRALTMDFKSWKRQLSDVRGRFSEKGWTGFLRALKESKIIEVIQSRNVIIHATLDGAAVITATIKGPVYGWEIKVPVLVSMETTEGVVGTYRWNVSLLIRRADQRDKPDGIEVHQFLVKER